MTRVGILAAGVVVVAFAFACGGDDSTGGTSGTSSSGGTTLGDGNVAATDACKSENGSAPVVAPTFVRNVKTGETGWYAAPAVVDLDGDGKMEIVAALYSTFVFAADGTPRGANGP